MRRATRFQIAAAAILAWALVIPGAANAADRWNHEIAGGLSVFLGVQPAAMISRAHPRDHPELEMHDGPAPGRHEQHVMVAVFNAETGERIEDATVEARVTPLGLGPVTRALQPMAIADTVTYGNYFTMSGDGRYQIRVSITPAEATRPTIVEFSHDHRTR
jgi:hypothetical protein